MQKTQFTMTLIASAILTACGGSGGGGSLKPDPAPRTTFSPTVTSRTFYPPLPLQKDERLSPIYTEEGILYVGVQVQERIRQGDLIKYFQLGRRIPRKYFPEAPSVEFKGFHLPSDKERVIRAVQLINASLPMEEQIRVEGSSPYKIYVEMISNSRVPWPGYAGVSPVSYKRQHMQIQVKTSTRSLSDEQQLAIWTHEILHALRSDYGNHPPRTVQDTVLHGLSGDYPASILFPIDRAALEYLYFDFGPWNATITSFQESTEYVSYGVSLRGSHVSPWAYGEKPWWKLKNNPYLTGTIIWEGALVGVTPKKKEVTGDAEIIVSMETMTGSAEFTELSWDKDDLRYHIDIEGNIFYSNNGELTGIFVGETHKGAGGTLCREDLTAAFGAERVPD